MTIPNSLTVRSALLAGLLVAGLAACAGDADADPVAVDDPAPAPVTADDPDAGAGEEPVEESVDDPGDTVAGGTGRATVTMNDGTEYSLEVSSCDTSFTDPVGFPLTDGYDLSGSTAGGEFRFYIARAGFSDEQPVETGLFEGDFDEKGQNPGILYSADMDTVDAVVDGAKVSGAVSMRAIQLTRPHGDDTVATFDFRC